MDVKDIKKVDIIKLKLDTKNPRFAELYNGSDKQDDLIEYLLNSEAAIEIVKALDDAKEYYADRPLWVIEEDNSGEYRVKDGNRRFAAVLALRDPHAFGLSQTRQTIDELPVIIYKSEAEVDKRILQEHTSSLFKEWDRIAKALRVFDLRLSGTNLEALFDIDSNPASLLMLAGFYYNAVVIGGEDLKQLLRRGRGSTGGKAVIFERLFKYRKKCGYDFTSKPAYDMEVTNEKVFEKYIKSMVALLKDDITITHSTVDKSKEDFLDKLGPYGFKPIKESKIKKSAIKSAGEDVPANSSEVLPTKTTDKSSIKQAPSYDRKAIPGPVDRTIRECYDLDRLYFTNAKVAMTRISFECVLKYVIENTEYIPGKKLSESSYFRDVYYRGAQRLKYTNFSKMKELFAPLIIDTGISKAFSDFDLERPHQIIHNYIVGAVPGDAITICDNLMPLIEFMLQDEQELLNMLDKNKL